MKKMSKFDKEVLLFYSESSGIPFHVLKKRVGENGWSLDRAISTDYVRKTRYRPPRMPQEEKEKAGLKKYVLSSGDVIYAHPKSPWMPLRLVHFSSKSGRSPSTYKVRCICLCNRTEKDFFRETLESSDRPCFRCLKGASARRNRERRETLSEEQINRINVLSRWRERWVVLKKKYGERLCPEWKDNCKDFKSWCSSQAGNSKGLSVGIKDPQGEIGPDNCYLFDAKEARAKAKEEKAGKNLREKEERRKRVETLKAGQTFLFEGEELTLREIARRKKISPYLLHSRIWYLGWSLEEAVSDTKKPTIFYKGKEWGVSELAREHNIHATTIYNRVLRCGWEVEEALNTPGRPYRQSSKKY